MPDIPNLPETLKVMGNYNRRMIALIIILVFALAGMTIKAYFGKSDCQSVQDQVDKLTASQGRCIESNSRLMARVDELTKGYLHIDSMLANVKPDTVIMKTTERYPINDRAPASVGVAVEESSPMVDESHMLASAPPPPLRRITRLTSLSDSKVLVKKGNSDKVMNSIKTYITQKID
jgi:hypothetical protein